MPDHSLEPWTWMTTRHGYCGIADAQGKSVLHARTSFFKDTYIDVSNIDACRILACVNALAGVPDEALKDLVLLDGRCVEQRTGLAELIYGIADRAALLTAKGGKRRSVEECTGLSDVEPTDKQETPK